MATYGTNVPCEEHNSAIQKAIIQQRDDSAVSVPLVSLQAVPRFLFCF